MKFTSVHPFQKSWRDAGFKNNALLAISLLGFILLLAGLWGIDIQASHAALPRLIGYQSKLKTSDGTAVTTATKIQFSLYLHLTNGSPADTPSAAGPLLWTETYDGSSGSCAKITPDSQGFFSVQLGSCASLPSYIDFTQTLYLGVKVESDDEATPRVKVTTFPYAFNAERVSGLLATTTATGGQLLSLDSNLNFNLNTGSFAGAGISLASTTATSYTLGKLAVGTTTADSTLTVQAAAGVNPFTIASSTGVSLVTVTQTGNVGIGTTTPAQKLVVAGDVRIAGALYDSSNSAGTTGYIFQSTGSGIQWVATSTLGLGGGSSLTGSGVDGYVTRWMSAANLSTGILLDNGTIAGINATSSSYTFNLQGTTGINPLNIASSSSTSLLTVTQAGNVGIGTTTPTAVLTVKGTYPTSTSISRFVALGSGGTNSIAYSDDNGLNWTGLGTSVFSTTGYGVAWNGTRFVAVGVGTNSIAYSSDGISWTGLGTSIISNTGYGVAWNGTRFVAVGEGSTNTIAYSSDGISWTGIGKSIFSTSGRGVAWNGTRFVAVGFGGNTIAYSSDGISWTGIGTSIFSTSGYGVAWNGTRFVAVGSGTNTIAYSSDGISWTGIGTSIFSGGSGFGVGSAPAPQLVPPQPGMGGGPPPNYDIQQWQDSTGATVGVFNSNGRFAVGTSSLTSTLRIQAAAGVNPFNIASSSGASLLTVTQAGNVGIGTTSPIAGLHVGSATSGMNARIANGWLCVDNNDTCTGATTAGTVYAVGTYTTGADLAESYPTKDLTLEPGEVVAADGANPVHVVRASSTSVLLGVISTKPGVLLGGFDKENYLDAITVSVALAGRVPVKVTSENGQIKPGDYLTVSPTMPGYATKAIYPGYVIGQALENHTSGNGAILVFINKTYFVPKIADLLQNGHSFGLLADDVSTLILNDSYALNDLVVVNTMYVGKKLVVKERIETLELMANTVTAKEKLCVGQTCVTEEQLKAVLQLLNGQGGRGSLSGQTAGESVQAPPPADPMAPPESAASPDDVVTEPAASEQLAEAESSPPAKALPAPPGEQSISPASENPAAETLSAPTASTDGQPN